MKYLIETFGCRVNQAESIQIEKDLQSAGFAPALDKQKPDLVVVNSCVVTHKAERQLKQKIRSLRREYPDSFLVVVGCGPAFWRLKKQGFVEVADLLLDNQQKRKIVSFLPEDFLYRSRIIAVPRRVHDKESGMTKEFFENNKDRFRVPSVGLRAGLARNDTMFHFYRFRVKPGMTKDKPEMTKDKPGMTKDKPGMTKRWTGKSRMTQYFSPFTSVRALVKIQSGCDQFCSYCIVPHVRTKLYSKPIKQAVDEVGEWVKKGIEEVVFTGINLALYEPGLVNLLQKILAETKIKRIRFGSIKVEAFTDELIKLYQQEYQKNNGKTRLCRNFHIPLQSGSGKILEKMGRNYTLQSYKDLFGKIKQEIPDVTIGTDLIVGFPNETKTDFEKSLRLIKKLKFLKVHIFRFSPRKSTTAAMMIKTGKWEAVNPKVIKQKAKKARQVAGRVRREVKKSVKKGAVLFEQEVNPGVFEGYSDNFIRVKKKSEKNLMGKIGIIRVDLPAGRQRHRSQNDEC